MSGRDVYAVVCEAAKRSTHEVEAFKARSSDRWFGYWRDAPTDTPTELWVPTIRTFMGDRLADVTSWGREYRSPGFGRSSVRRNFRAKGIDGREWYGVYYKSSGDYVRMRARKVGG